MPTDLSALVRSDEQSSASDFRSTSWALRLLVGILPALFLGIALTPIFFHRSSTSPGSRGEFLFTLVLAGMAGLGTAFLSWKCRHYRLLAERLLRHKSQETEFVELAFRLISATEREEIAECIASRTLDLAGVPGVFVELVDNEGGEVEIVAAAGRGVPAAGNRVHFEASTSARVAEHRHPQYIESDGGSSSYRDTLEKRIAAPLRSGDEVLGALVLVPHPPSSDIVDLASHRIQIVANFAALAFRRVGLLEEAKARRKEIERHLESKARLIRGFTHDLKNPIGAIDGYAQVLEAGIRGELAPAHREYVARIRQANRSMLDLIDDLVELARAETGELRIERREIDPSNLLDRVLDEYRAHAAARGLILEARGVEELPSIETDPDRVRQILGNLLSNAIKYTPSPGRVTLTAGPATQGNAPEPGKWFAISVSDTGPGIDPSAQVEIFEEFTRLSPDDYQGAGLGLSISRHIARALGGELTVESEPEVGSTFTLWLPAP